MMRHKLKEIFNWGKKEHSYFAIIDIVDQSRVSKSKEKDNNNNYIYEFNENEYKLSETFVGNMEYLVCQFGEGITGDQFHGILLFPYKNDYIVAEFST